MSNKPFLSLIICSCNRASSLQKVLQTIHTEEMLAVGGELILVDNSSTDTTLKVMQACRDSMPFPVIVVSEPVAGLGRARNSGLEHARGEVIAFTDDDCYLQAGYLLKAAEVFDNGLFKYCGGRILLHDPDDAMVAVDYREKFKRIPPRSFVPAGEIQGASMIVSREVFDAIGPFDPELGAGREFRCEDAEFVARASMHGFTGAHVPELVVYHHHGRKAGDVPAHVQGNHFARGAYYAIMLGRRQWKYLFRWLLQYLLPRPRTVKKFGYFRRLHYELLGAWRYTRSRRQVVPDTGGGLT
jgi:glycosyltransferase involved in cell wall biosynthesis